MANVVFNVAKGRQIEFWNRVVSNDPAASGLVMVLLKTAEADSTLVDYDTLAALLAAPGNVEADFTNYARIEYTDADLPAPSLDDANNRYDASLPAKSIASAGGTLDNTLAKAVLCYAPDVAGADSTLVPVAAYDAVVSTNGQTLNVPGAVVIRAS